jgi:uncharacterized membrane protein YgcG
MSLSLTRLDRAQKHLPPGLPQRIGADLLLTLFVWQQLSARCQIETKAIASQCAGQPDVVTHMLNRIPIPFPPHCLFDACLWSQPNLAGVAIYQCLLALCQHLPHLDRIVRPERFASDAPWAHLFANTPIWASIMQQIGSIPATPLLPLGPLFEQALAHLLPGGPAMPPALAKLMVQLLTPWRKASIYDPLFGQGQLLFAALAQVEQGNSTHLLRLRGQEPDPDQWALAALYLLAKELDYRELQRGDPLTMPLLQQANRQMLQSDLILCHLPPQPMEWNHSFARFDCWDRFPHRAPVDGRIGLMWHMLASLRPAGRMAILVWPAMLHDPDWTTLLRYVLDNNLLDTVIELPRTLWPNLSEPPLLLLFRHQRVRQKVGFISARSSTVLGALLAGPPSAKALPAYDSSAIRRAHSDYQFNRLHPYLCEVDTRAIKAHDLSLNLQDYANWLSSAGQEENKPGSCGGSSSGGSRSSGGSSSSSGSSSGSSRSKWQSGSTAGAVWPVYGTKPDITIGVVPGEGWLKRARVNWNAVGQSVSFPHFLAKKL